MPMYESDRQTDISFNFVIATAAAALCECHVDFQFHCDATQKEPTHFIRLNVASRHTPTISFIRVAQCRSSCSMPTFHAWMMFPLILLSYIVDCQRDSKWAHSHYDRVQLIVWMRIRYHEHNNHHVMWLSSALVAYLLSHPQQIFLCNACISKRFESLTRIWNHLLLFSIAVGVLVAMYGMCECAVHTEWSHSIGFQSAVRWWRKMLFAMNECFSWMEIRNYSIGTYFRHASDGPYVAFRVVNWKVTWMMSSCFHSSRHIIHIEWLAQMMATSMSHPVFGCFDSNTDLHQFDNFNRLAIDRKWINLVVPFK